MEGVSRKREKRQHVQQALCSCADFLSCYRHLANAHPVDFIVSDLWNAVLPETIQKELCALSVKELFQLPLCEVPNVSSPDCTGESATEGACVGQKDCSSLISETERLNVNSDIGSLPVECTVRVDAVQWKHPSLQSYMAEVKTHCLEHCRDVDTSVRSLGDFLQGEDDPDSSQGLFVHAFMNEKKMHEVEIMANVCTHIFHKSASDVVIDLGSGKGYLSTHLSLHSGLPVIGVDSQSHHTTGATKRAEKLNVQWNSLVKNEERKHLKSKGKNNAEHRRLPTKKEENVFNSNRASHQTDLDTIYGSCDRSCDTSLHSQTSKSQQQEAAGKSLQDQTTDLVIENQFNETSKTNVILSDTEIERLHKPGHGKSKGTESSKEPAEAGNSKHVNVTMFVKPETDLAEVLRAHLSVLCPGKDPEHARLFMTGLHTCGPLASSMLRIFVEDRAVQAVCGVGCCYQLMQETFEHLHSGHSHESQNIKVSGAHCGSGTRDIMQAEGDFPLSTLLRQKRSFVGRVALNMASLAVSRMADASGELQGKTFYPRALLQAFIKKKLGYIPPEMKKLRKLAKFANSPVDFVIKGLLKLDIPGCKEATEEEVTSFHRQHCHLEEKMAAFFQLRATLAPVVETVVLLDRLLFLLEQDCVEDAFLVRLFDPVTSPRCHALIAVKKDSPIS